MYDYPQNTKAIPDSYQKTWDWSNPSDYEFQSYPSRNTIAHTFPSRRWRRYSNIELSEKGCENCKNRRKYVGDVFGRFADLTSLQGISFLNRARRPFAKTLWAIIFITALTVAIMHSYLVCSSYLSYETTTTVNIVNTNLDFPSVTFCNLNPVQVNKVEAMSAEVPQWQTLLKLLRPKSDYNLEYDDLPSTIVFGKDRLNVGNKSGKPKRRLSDVYLSNITNFYNTLDIHDSLDLLADDRASTTTKFSALIKEVLAKTDRIDVANITHSLEDMLIDCSYDGRVCDESNFTSRYHNEYGKCWTFNSDEMRQYPLKTSQSGALLGLGFSLFLQTQNHVTGLNIGKGIRMHIHKHNTLPFVTENGISISPGFSTYVGMSLTNKTNIGGRYGACDDLNGEFQTYYKSHDYTFTGCVNTCLDRTISKKCRCYRETYSEYYNKDDRNTLPKCTEKRDIRCTLKYTRLFEQGKLNCKCHQGCNSVKYELEISNDKWPDENMWWLIVSTICDGSNIDDCNYLKNISIDKRRGILRSNFLQVKIYFKELNVENIKEMKSYGDWQFISDLGGAVGLWLGASILTLFEIADLLLQLCNYCNRKKIYEKRDVSQDKQTNSSYFGTPSMMPKKLVFSQTSDVFYK